MAVSPHGSRVFVAGASYGGRATGLDYKTVAYSGVTGRQVWARLYRGPGHREDLPAAVAVSPGGAAVFVTGYAPGWGTDYDYATVAYGAATGRQLWTSRYTSQGKHDDAASAVAVSPDGATVFVTGASGGNKPRCGRGCPAPGDGYATVACSAATGRQLWASRYNGPAIRLGSAADSVAVSPDGATVFVTGESDRVHAGGDAATVAYSAATGRQLWVSRYDGPDYPGVAWSVAVRPAGGTVFVTGTTAGQPLSGDYATVAYRAATGRQLWARHYNGPANDDDLATSVAVSPDGTTVFVTGFSAGRTYDFDYATVAYNSATGRQL